MLFGLFETGPEPRPATGSFEPEPYGSCRLVRFANGLELDTRSELGVNPGSVLEAGTYWLLNCQAPIRRDWLSELSRHGLEPVCYVAYQNLVCRAGRSQEAQALLNLPYLYWLGPHPPAAKLAPELLTLSGRHELVLALWPDEPLEPAVEAILVAGGQVLGLGRGTVRFRLDAEAARDLAGLRSVSWVQKTDPVEPFNSEAQWVLQTGWQPAIPDPVAGRPVWRKGIRGQGMVVGLFDSGINTEHDAFCDPQFPLFAPGIYPRHRKIAAYKLYGRAEFGDAGGANYHGSGVAATAVGNDSVCGDYSKADGMAPDARVYFVDIATSNGGYVYDDDMTALLDSVRLSRGMNEPVRQVSGSFGSVAYLGQYRLMDATVDAVTWLDKSFFVIWAAGNEGGTEHHIAHPACAKNCLTVGATLNGTESNRVAEFSSWGPTRDDRIKPNIVAPGRSVTTVHGPSPFAYSSRSGTSLAAPAASGALLLLRQYLRDGWYPHGIPDTAHSLPTLSAALLRAFAIAATDVDIDTAPVPNGAVGWGQLNLSNLLHFSGDSVVVRFWDDTFGLATGQFREYHVDVLERKPLRIVLAWTDTAAAPEALVALVNDLDLEVTSPDLNSYRGNQFLNGQSRTNPSTRDERNVEEVVLVNRPLTGRWTIRVRARNVFARYQPYATMVRGSVEPIPAIASDSHLPSWAAPVPARLVSRANPLRIRVAPGASIDVVTPAGSVAATLHPAADGKVEWFGTDARGRDLAAGVYFYRVTRPGARGPLGRILVLR